MQTQLIANLTEGTFFSYESDYTPLLKSLFETDAVGQSRWLRTDKIVFVPSHLNDYVRGKYEYVFPAQRFL
jgi:hypothetical protein